MNESFSTSELVYLNFAGKHGKTLGYILMGGSMFTFYNVLINRGYFMEIFCSENS